MGAIRQGPEGARHLPEPGAGPGGMTADGFGRFLVSEREKWARVGASVGVKLD